MQFGSPAHSVSHCLSHVLTVGFEAEVPASEAPSCWHRPSDAAWQTMREVCEDRSWAACAHVSGTPIAQSASPQRHSRSMTARVDAEAAARQGALIDRYARAK